MNNKNLVGALCIGLFLAASGAAHGAFIKSDFSIVILPENNFIQKGDRASFNLKLTNHSNEDAIFGTNVRQTFFSADSNINSVTLHDSPYFLDWDFETPFPFEFTVASGESIIFNFFSILVSSEITLDSVITLTGADMGFENIPAAFPNDNKGYDFYISASNQASITVVPVPAAVWLFGSGLLGLIGVARHKEAA